jgi:hypothetical protein
MREGGRERERERERVRDREWVHENEKMRIRRPGKRKINRETICLLS